MSVEHRIRTITQLDQRYATSYARNDASLIALGAAIHMLSEHQWEMVEATVRELLPKMHPNLSDPNASVEP